MKRILLPTDFSINAMNALHYARRLFQHERVDFVLFHAYEPSVLQFLGNKSPSALKRTYHSLKVKTIKQLEGIKAEVLASNDFGNHRYLVEAREGHLVELIDAMTLKDYHYIVMGSKGATGMKELILGSTTFDVVTLRHNIPLLIIPENALFLDIENIGFATQSKHFYFKDELRPLIEFANLWKATVRTIKIYDTQNITGAQLRHLERLKKLLTSVNSSFHVIEKYSSIEDCINEFEEELDIDLLVMLDYSKTFFESLTEESVIKKLTFHTTIPFLILRGLS